MLFSRRSTFLERAAKAFKSKVFFHCSSQLICCSSTDNNVLLYEAAQPWGQLAWMCPVGGRRGVNGGYTPQNMCEMQNHSINFIHLFAKGSKLMLEIQLREAGLRSNWIIVITWWSMLQDHISPDQHQTSIRPSPSASTNSYLIPAHKTQTPKAGVTAVHQWGPSCGLWSPLVFYSQTVIMYTLPWLSLPQLQSPAHPCWRD